LVVASVLVALALTACGGSPSTAATPLPTGSLAHNTELLQGRTLFAANCASCHGTAGGGGLGPKFTGGRLQRDFPDIDAQIAFVKRGRGIMPAWGSVLSGAQIRAVVSYERDVLSDPQSHSAS
jgi:mono/diheme cytochrome c family protein